MGRGLGWSSEGEARLKGYVAAGATVREICTLTGWPPSSTKKAMKKVLGGIPLTYQRTPRTSAGTKRGHDFVEAVKGIVATDPKMSLGAIKDAAAAQGHFGRRRPFGAL